MGPGRTGPGSWVARTLRWRGWAQLRVPLAGVCICAGIAGLGMPVWSGWWYAHIQASRRLMLRSELKGGPSTAASGPAAFPSADFPALPPPPAPGAAGLVATPGATVGLPADVASGQPLAELEIPTIGLDSTVLEGLTYDPSVWNPLLRDGPAHVLGSALPGQPGNVVIFGHLNIWGAVFLHLNELRTGDPIDFVTPYGRFQYRVTGSQVIVPTDVSAVAVRHGGPATVQLVTCNGLLDAHRLVVDASLVGTPVGGEG